MKQGEKDYLSKWALCFVQQLFFFFIVRSMPSRFPPSPTTKMANKTVHTIEKRFFSGGGAHAQKMVGLDTAWVFGLALTRWRARSPMFLYMPSVRFWARPAEIRCRGEGGRWSTGVAGAAHVFFCACIGGAGVALVVGRVWPALGWWEAVGKVAAVGPGRRAGGA